MTHGGGEPGNRGIQPGDRGTQRATSEDQDTRFGSTLLRVLLVQVATLLLLWLLQATYHA